VAKQGVDIVTTSSNISEQTTTQDADMDDASEDEAQQDDKGISMVWYLVFALIGMLAGGVYLLFRKRTEKDRKSGEQKQQL